LHAADLGVGSTTDLAGDRCAIAAVATAAAIRDSAITAGVATDCATTARTATTTATANASCGVRLTPFADDELRLTRKGQQEYAAGERANRHSHSKIVTSTDEARLVVLSTGGASRVHCDVHGPALPCRQR